MHLDFWFEFASTYSYPAAMRIEQLAAGCGVELRWRPFLLGPIFHAQGWDDSPFNLYPEKGRYMWRDLERICRQDEIPFRRPSVFPRNGLLAARIACCFSGSPWIPAFVRSVYRANFADDADISSIEILSGCLADSALDPNRVFDEAQSAQSNARLRQQSEEAASLGIFGAPSFRVGRELFWGNDRIEVALEWATRPKS